MGQEEAGVGPAPGARLRAREEHWREGRPGHRGTGRRLQKDAQQGRRTENEPAQVHEGGGHGGTVVPERGQRSPQSYQPILLRSYLRKYYNSTHSSIPVHSCAME